MLLCCREHQLRVHIITIYCILRHAEATDSASPSKFLVQKLLFLCQRWCMLGCTSVLPNIYTYPRSLPFFINMYGICDKFFLCCIVFKYTNPLRNRLFILLCCVTVCFCNSCKCAMLKIILKKRGSNFMYFNAFNCS